MNPIQVLVRRATRLWVLERTACSLLLGAAWALNGLLLALLLSRRLDFPSFTLVLLVLLPLAIFGVLAVRAAWHAPQGERAARLLDERAGTNDLFSSALEFMRQPERFGWLGELACQKALAHAAGARLEARWQLGTRRQWLSAGTLVVVLLAFYLVFVVGQWGAAGSAAQGEAAVIQKLAKAPAAASSAAKAEEPGKPKEESGTDHHVALAEEFAVPAQKEEAKQPEKITQEMVDRYMQSIPENQEVNLEDI